VSLGKYVVLVLAAVATLLAAAWPFLPAEPAGRSAVAAGGALAAFNTVLAYYLVLWSSARSTNVFLGAVLGGMVGRMALMLAAVVTGVLVFDLPKVPFAISLLAFFVLFLVLELTILHRRTGASAGAR
jgi:fructose-specific phosphotransferase system IIC component